MLSFGVTPTAESTFPVLSTASREAAALQAGFGPVPEGLLFAGLIPLRPTVSEAKPALSPLVEPPVPGIAPPLEAPPADLAALIGDFRDDETTLDTPIRHLQARA